MYIYMYAHTCVCIYIYREREREMDIHTHIYMHIQWALVVLAVLHQDGQRYICYVCTCTYVLGRTTHRRLARAAAQGRPRVDAPQGLAHLQRRVGVDVRAQISLLPGPGRRRARGGSGGGGAAAADWALSVVPSSAVAYIMQIWYTHIYLSIYLDR